jgi:large subunit ribosomal protein L21
MSRIGTWSGENGPIKSVDKHRFIHIITVSISFQGTDMYAVIKTGGKQHRVSEGDVLKIEKLAGQKGDTVVFEEVLLVSKEDQTRVGQPVVEGAKVVGEIVHQGKGPKIIIFKKKRRKGFLKKTGHRQPLTEVRIKEISL